MIHRQHFLVGPSSFLNSFSFPFIFHFFSLNFVPVACPLSFFICSHGQFVLVLYKQLATVKILSPINFHIFKTLFCTLFPFENIGQSTFLLYSLYLLLIFSWFPWGSSHLYLAGIIIAPIKTYSSLSLFFVGDSRAWKTFSYGIKTGRIIFFIYKLRND